MGAWGAGLFDDDLALDVRGDFADALASGLSPQEAADEMMAEYTDKLDDLDDGPVMILALASLLIDHGIQQHPVLDLARQVIRTDSGLDRWAEAGEIALAARKAVYEEFGHSLDI